MTVLKKLAKIDPAVVIDGGANVGKYSLMTNEIIPNAQIYSFEPVKDTFAKLKNNVKGRKNINPIEKGLYKDNGTKEINLFSSSTHSSLVDIEGLHYSSTQKQKIELIKGDDFLKENNIDEIDLLKIDVEGAEYETLLGFEEHLNNGKIKMIQFEYGYINITTKKLLIDYYKFFEEKGYVVGKIFPKIVEFRKYHFKYENFLGSNFVAVKETENELINYLAGK